jgi:hypothetical protein
VKIEKDCKSSILIFLTFVLVDIVMLISMVSDFSIFTFNKAYADPLNFPVGVAVDPAGNVFDAELENNRFQKFTNTGKFIPTYYPKVSCILVDPNPRAAMAPKKPELKLGSSRRG